MGGRAEGSLKIDTRRGCSLVIWDQSGVKLINILDYVFAFSYYALVDMTLPLQGTTVCWTKALFSQFIIYFEDDLSPFSSAITFFLP